MPLEKKIFAGGGLNFDDEARIVPPNDYRRLLNGRSGTGDQAGDGSIENVRGNVLVTEFNSVIESAGTINGLPGGQNVCIGALEDIQNKKIYYWIYNSSGSHQIREFDIKTKRLSLIIEDPNLNLQKDFLITGANIVEGLLRWTDNFNDPGRINVVRAKNTWLSSSASSDKYPTPFRKEYIDAISYAPPCEPQVEYGSDTSIQTNSLRGKLYQFKYRWIDIDNQESTWSPISEVALPVAGSLPFRTIYIPPEISNQIIVTVETGSPIIKRIEIASREGNISDFRLIKTLDKEEIGIPSDSSYAFTFLNDESYIPIDINKSNLLFSNLPQKAKGQDLIDGGRIAYGNIVDGFDQVPVDVITTPVYNPIETSSDPTFNIFGPFATYVRFEITSTPEESQAYILSVTFKDTTISPAGLLSPDISVSYTHVAASGETDIDILQGLCDQFNGDSSVNTIAECSPAPPFGPSVFEIKTKPFVGWEIKSFGIVGYGASKVTAVRSFKRGSKHPLGVVYYDSPNRSGTTNISDDTNVYVEWFSDTIEKGSVDIEFTIFNTPPLWATHWQIVYAGNQITNRFLQFIAGSVSTVSDRTTISLSALDAYQSSNPDTVLTYDFSKGDRIRIIKDGAGDYVSNYQDTEILGYDSGSNVITIVNIPEVTAETGMLFEIYTPKPEIEEKLYFEMGECHEIGNPQTPSRYHKGTVEDQLPADTPTTTITGSLYVREYSASEGTKTNFAPNGHAVVGLFPGGSWGTAKRGDIITINDAETDTYDGTFKVLKRGDATSYGFGGTKPTVIVVEDNPTGDWLEISAVFVGGELGTGPIPPGGTLPPGVLGLPFVINTQHGQATVLLKNQGDVYFKTRNFTTAVSHQVEDFNYSDFYVSNYYNKGRPNKVDAGHKNIRRPATIFYSEPLIPNTNINGLGYFFELSFEEYDRSYGSIQKLHSEDKRLICFQELKVGGILVNSSVLFDQQGNPSVEKSNAVLSDIIYYAGEYGIGKNPESFAVYGNRKYFIDVSRGAVLRLSQDGITPISDIKARDFFTDSFKEAADQIPPPSAFGVYDKRFDEYVLSFTKVTSINAVYDKLPGTGEIVLEFSSEDIGMVPVPGEITICFDDPSTSEQICGLGYVTSDAPGNRVKVDIEGIGEFLSEGDSVIVKLNKKQTIAFNEKTKRWSSFYSYIPENMVGNVINIATFKDGNIWLHNENDVYNNFYGEQYSSEIEVISNENPGAVKFYLNVEQDSNSVWYMPKATNSFGQQTSLIVEDFENIEGVFWAEILKDELTPISDPIINPPIIQGDDIRGHELIMNFKNNDTTFVRLFAIGVRHHTSENTNR